MLLKQDAVVGARYRFQSSGVRVNIDYQPCSAPGELLAFGQLAILMGVVPDIPPATRCTLRYQERDG